MDRTLSYLSDRAPWAAVLAIHTIALAAAPAAVAAEPPAADRLPKAIEDNSFFIEEAYNQEDGVVQHIFGCVLSGEPARTLDCTFTQEWPAGGRAHQLSYTASYAWQGEGAADGAGDVMLNYRYQAVDRDRTAFAPRLSVSLPTGLYKEGLGAGSPGVQVNLPVSVRLGRSWIAHGNLGGSHTPRARAVTRSGAEARDDLSSFAAGGSVISLLTPRFNVLLEALYTRAEAFDATGAVEREWILSPGVRGALDVGSMQIVPGLALPIILQDDDETVGVFLYLSFEHPFR